MVRLAVVAGVNDDRVVQHRAVAFRDRTERRRDACDLFELKTANLCASVENILDLPVADTAVQTADAFVAGRSQQIESQCDDLSLLAAGAVLAGTGVLVDRQFLAQSSVS